MTPQKKHQTVAYIRVSTTEQNTARQLEAVGPVDRVFEEKISGGSRKDRAALAQCIEYIREGDVVIVASMDRLARSLRDLRDIVDEITGKGATVRFVKESQTYSADSADPMSTLLLHILGAFAEFERSLIHERQADGIRIAKAAGKYAGRKPKLTVEQTAALRERIAQGVPKAVVAREFGIDRSTLYRLM